MIDPSLRQEPPLPEHETPICQPAPGHSVPASAALERLTGVVERITFHNPENGWTVLKVAPFRSAGELVTVVIHQAQVFAGATIEFQGRWTRHAKHGEQFQATQAIEKKPASTAALEKYLGSGLIRGVGPPTAKKIVSHFKEKTLEIFETNIEELLKVPGIKQKKLESIRDSWQAHRAIRDVMVFLQGYGISTLFAVKIFKTYGDRAIPLVSENPYILARDIYGIGFFSADRIALRMGFAARGVARIEAGVKHVLAASRDQGHCYLTETQVISSTQELLAPAIAAQAAEATAEAAGAASAAPPIEAELILEVLRDLVARREIKCRQVSRSVSSVTDEARTKTETATEPGYYAKTLYFDEITVARRLHELLSHKVEINKDRVERWVDEYCTRSDLSLSQEQRAAIAGIVASPFAILTGGPGCGKTTTTRVLVALLRAMRRQVLLAAPTGRAAQRMMEVIGLEAKTLHRLLEWVPQMGGFKKNADDPLIGDFLIVDECSMLDISLAAKLLEAVPNTCQVLFIGDPDQLPAVGAGDVLRDGLRAANIPRFCLTQVFRQAAESTIIRFAHTINRGEVPAIQSPMADPKAFEKGIDCLFVDADEATQEQIRFLQRARYVLASAKEQSVAENTPLEELLSPPPSADEELRRPLFYIPEKFQHVDLVELARSRTIVDELKTILRRVHPWSSLHYGLTAVDTVVRLYTKTIPEWLGPNTEIQVLTPQVRGTLGTHNLNQVLQQAANPPSADKPQLRFGDRLFRLGDRVIQTRNNYDLGVFNGDIGRVFSVDPNDQTLVVRFSGPEKKDVEFTREDFADLTLAYAITVHKSQGSEFAAVIFPVMSQHFNMLFRNLIYTGVTRARRLAVFVGGRAALGRAIRQVDSRRRQTTLAELLEG